jgi:hypothetical protein
LAAPARSRPPASLQSMGWLLLIPPLKSGRWLPNKKNQTTDSPRRWLPNKKNQTTDSV